MRGLAIHLGTPEIRSRTCLRNEHIQSLDDGITPFSAGGRANGLQVLDHPLGQFNNGHHGLLMVKLKIKTSVGKQAIAGISRRPPNQEPKPTATC